MKHTIADVAKEAGVSITTVSRVMNGNYPVKLETKERVEAAIKKLEFIPNPFAKGLISKKTYTIGIIVPSISNLFFTEVIGGIEKFAALYEYDVILTETTSNPVLERKKIEKFLNRMIDGIIIVGPQLENMKNGFIEKISKEIPLVCINGYSKGVDVRFVLSDEENGAIIAMKHLAELGHENIAFVRGGDSYSYDIKEEVYRKFVDEDKIKILGIPSGNNIEVVENTSRKIREMHDMDLEGFKAVTAFFACNDLMAIGVLSGLEALGIKVPEEVSIVGWDNTSLSQMVTPKLTTIDLHMRQLGGKAAEMLFDQMLDKKELEEKIEIVPTNLVIRNSCEKI